MPTEHVLEALGLSQLSGKLHADAKADAPPPLDAQALEDKFKKKIEEAQKKQPG